MSVCSFCLLNIQRPLPSLCAQHDGHYLFKYIQVRINIHFVTSCPFCRFLSPPFSLSFSPLHSGAKGLCVCWPHSSTGWWEWVTSGYLHSGARPSRCWGFLGDRAVWTKWKAKCGWVKWHQHYKCALLVATAELCPGEDAHLCRSPPGLANRVSHTLHTKCSV